MHHIDLWMSLAGVIVGVTVGLTGMGGGALMTPILILVFGVNPGTAVSSDLLTSLIMKPIGGTVHLRRGTVAWGLVRWLVIGSVPAAFSGVIVLRALGNSKQVNDDVQLAIGAALIVATAGLLTKAAISARRSSGPDPVADLGPPAVKRLATLLIGVIGGFMVGMTSVGSGSLMLVLLLSLYPTLTSKSLVGTDLVQAIPLVGAATLGHALFGHISLGLTGSLLLGSIPGVYLGARLSSSAPDAVVRPVLTLVLMGSALKLLEVPTVDVLWSVGGMAVVGFVLWGAMKTRSRSSRDTHVDRQDGGVEPGSVAPIGVGAIEGRGALLALPDRS